MLDVLVLGGGQAGLSTSHHLQRQNLTHLVLDEGERAGGAWTSRWKALTLEGLNALSALPGVAPLEADPQTPARESVPRYHQQYQEEWNLPIERQHRAQAVTRTQRGYRTTVQSPSGEKQIESRAIVNATGSWNNPHIPTIPGREEYEGREEHTRTYQGAESHQGENVLVIGGGISALQLLLELEGYANTTWATRRPPSWREITTQHLREAVREIERRYRDGEAARSVVSHTGLPDTPHTRAGRERGVLQAHPMPTRITQDGAAWDETEKRYDTILWCTGFHPDIAHLAPLQLQEPNGTIRIEKTRTLKDPHVHLLGYGPSASSIGANRYSRHAALELRKELT